MTIFKIYCISMPDMYYSDPKPYFSGYINSTLQKAKERIQVLSKEKFAFLTRDSYEIREFELDTDKIISVHKYDRHENPTERSEV